MSRPRALLALAAATLLGGCASLTAVTPEQAFSEPPRSAIVVPDVPYHPQEALQCGPAALAEVLGWSGVAITPAELEPELFIPAREGTLRTEMVARARARDRVVYPLDGTLDALVRELRAGTPVLVFQNLGLAWVPVWHYAVMVGYDPAEQAFILRSGTLEHHRSPLDRFRRTWDRAERWAVVVVPPDRLPATATPASWLRAALDLESTGRTDAAEVAYRTGVARWPGHGGLHVALVNLRHARGDTAGTESAARRGLRTAESRRGVLHNNLATLLLQRCALEEAHAQARRATAQEDSPFHATFRATLEEVRRARRDPAVCPDAAPAPGDGGRGPDRAGTLGQTESTRRR